jgi:hypothetical protein
VSALIRLGSSTWKVLRECTEETEFEKKNKDECDAKMFAWTLKLLAVLCSIITVCSLFLLLSRTDSLRGADAPEGATPEEIAALMETAAQTNHQRPPITLQQRTQLKAEQRAFAWMAGGSAIAAVLCWMLHFCCYLLGQVLELKREVKALKGASETSA